jgi:hypothetical protein
LNKPEGHMTTPAAAEAANAARIKIKRIVHTIHAVQDIAQCRAKYLDVLGGLIFAEGYFEPEDRDMAEGGWKQAVGRVRLLLLCPSGVDGRRSA